jgi:2-polyprenyl-6-methoxyphenol hydroxylase-like FAD-dependent oxidoreductase
MEASLMTYAAGTAVSVPIGKRAVVIGAGMSGLPAARALADHFEEVIVLERDSLPAEATPRLGAPQSWHLHGLLGGGQRALGALFPGFELDLARAGAVTLRVGLDLRYERQGYDPFPQRDLGWVSYAMTRPLIELTLRRRLEQHGNITLRQCCRALEIAASPDGVAVIAIHFETTRGRRETLSADLVVDASARGSSTLALLRSIGSPLPEETKIGVDIGYASTVFAIPDNAPSDWKGVVTYPSAPESGRGCFLVPVENNCWMVAVSGRRGDWPPGDEDGFLAHAHGLRTPTLYNTIKQAKRVSEIKRFGFSESVWRHFEQLERLPRGLLPIGDLICCFNPVYGQGMSVAAQEACLLHRLLQTRAGGGDPLVGLGEVFLSEAQVLIESPWALAAIPDFVYPDTRGQRPVDFGNALSFASALTRIAARDPAVHKLMMEVQHLLKPRSAYRDPEFMLKVTAEMAEA